MMNRRQLMAEAACKRRARESREQEGHWGACVGGARAASN